MGGEYTMSSAKVLTEDPLTRLNLEAIVVHEVNEICESAGADGEIIRRFLTDVIVESLDRRTEEWRSKGINVHTASADQIAGTIRPSLGRIVQAAVAIASAEERTVMLIDILSAISIHMCAVWPLCRPSSKNI